MKLQSLQCYMQLVPSMVTVIIMYSNNSLHLHFLISYTWKEPAKYQVLFGQVQVQVQVQVL